MTIPPLPERLSSLPAKTVTAIEAYGQSAYRCGVQCGMGQAAHSIQMRLTEARNEGHKDGWTAALDLAKERISALKLGAREKQS
jgi:hypothetical protein